MTPIPVIKAGDAEDGRAQDRDASVSPVSHAASAEDAPYKQEPEMPLPDEQPSRAETEMSERGFRVLTEALPIIVWTAMPDGRADYFNRRWYEYCDLRDDNFDQPVGIEFEQLLHPDDVAETVARWRHCVESGDDFESECRFRRSSDGDYRWHLMRALPLRDADGTVIKWFGTATDIDEQKKTEQVRARLLELEREARDQAEASNRAKDEFIAVVSHELRSPLNAMLGWARVLRTDNVDAATRAHAVQVIEQSATMQSRLIEDLLDTARINAGKLRLDVQPLNLASVIRAALEIVRPSYEAKEMEVALDLDASAGLITGDPDRLQQVVWNLLSNAIKFTPRGGRIEVTLRREDPYVSFAVKDDGKGIHNDALPHIFDRFHQADNTGARRKGGLGLGLNLVRNLVEIHGGTITAESPGEGHGATFIINLPVRAVAAKVSEARLYTTETGELRAADFGTGDLRTSELRAGDVVGGLLNFPPVLQGLHILVVDDEEEARELVATLLRKYGATVTPVASSREALETLTDAAAEKFDLLVSDIGMPEEDGYTMIQRVRALAPERGGILPAIALTAYSRATDRIRALEVGFQMHVPKPVEPAELMMVIASLTGRGVK